MKMTNQSTIKIDNSIQNAEILRSMVSSFKIEDIIISDATAQRIYERVKSKLKK